jgi:hypothetical protein
MKVPWETLVKLHRSKLGRKRFGSLQEYAENFLKWLETEAPKLFPEEQQKGYAETMAWFCFLDVRDAIEDAMKEALEEAPPDGLTEDQQAALVTQVIEDRHAIWQSAKSGANLPAGFGLTVVETHKSVVDEARDGVFEKLPLSEQDLKLLNELAAFVFERFGPGTAPRSGAVVAGYGSHEVFPALIAYELQGIVNGRLKYRLFGDEKIRHDMGAAIVPFAQREMVHTFMEGIDPDLLDNVNQAATRLITELPSTIIDSIPDLTAERKKELKQILSSISEHELEKFRESFTEQRQARFARPIVSVVALLPKDELASLAESLVNLTSVKRRVSTDAETVGGPVDVAVISKGDGLVWIKRKHYFSQDLNPQFMANYFREDEDDETTEDAETDGTGKKP